MPTIRVEFEHGNVLHVADFDDDDHAAVDAWKADIIERHKAKMQALNPAPPPEPEPKRAPKPPPRNQPRKRK